MSRAIRARLPGFIEPCLPSRAEHPPAGGGWLHEVKHDGFRLIAQRDGQRMRLFTRNGHNWTTRFPLIARAVELLAARSCVLDGEAIVCDKNGLADFAMLSGRRHDGEVTLCAFDLLELDGRDLRREPIEGRKRLLNDLLAGCRSGLVVNRVFEDPGEVVYKYACALGCEGIVSKRVGSRYMSGPTDQWRKIINPAAPADRRPRRALIARKHES